MQASRCSMKISRLGTLRCKLGEGPVWDTAERALYFTDVLDHRVWRHDPVTGDSNSWQVPAPVGSFALRRDGGGAILAMGKGLHLLDFASGVTTSIAEPEAGNERVQFNDGKADRRGRFLAGTVELSGRDPLAALYSIDSRGIVTQLDAGFRITNGPCWSPDGGTFYLADSVAKVIYAYDYDEASGALGNQRRFIDTSSREGIPDGATVDAQGRLWSAQCESSKVVCYNLDGSIERLIEFPAAFVSSVMFGGADLERLFVTSIDPAVLASIAVASGAPPALPGDLGGALFVVDGLGVTGLPEHRYAG
jgi:sugar lactone lactonase YvrE